MVREMVREMVRTMDDDFPASVLVASDIHTARISARYDFLDIVTGGRVAVTTDGDHEALVLGCQSDPAVTELVTGASIGLGIGIPGTPTVVSSPAVRASGGGRIETRVGDIEAAVTETATADVFCAAVQDTALDMSLYGGTTIRKGETAIKQNPNGSAGRTRFENGSGHTFSAGDRDIVTISDKSLLVNAPIDIDGTLNRIGILVGDLLVEDNVILLGMGGGDDDNDDAGIQILSGPVSDIDVGYLSKFTDRSGHPVYMTTATNGAPVIDIDKVRESGLFKKRVVNKPGPRSKEGVRSREARLDESAWQVENGAFCVSRGVPAGTGIKKYHVAMRITDSGHFEFIRTTSQLVWNGDGYVVDPQRVPETKVLKRFINV